MTDEQVPRMIHRGEQVPGMPISDLFEWCLHKGLKPEEVYFTGGYLKWDSPETDAEKENYDAFQRSRDLRLLDWERETYERLKTKFGGGLGQEEEKT